MRVGHGLGVMVVLLLCAACDGVVERPGHDYSVRVLDESPIPVVGQIFAPVRFAVDGCGAFDLDLETASGERRPLDFTTRPDGTHVASVPVAWLMNDVFCWRSVRPPANEVDRGTLVATCQDAERSAKADFSIHPEIGGGWYSLHGAIRAVFPGAAIGVPWFIATSDYSGEVQFLPGGYLSFAWAPTLNPAAYRNSMVRPRLVRRGTRAFATLGCEAGAACPQVLVGPGETVRGERLADFEVSEEFAKTRAPRGIATVSSNVVDMAYADDGALVVVSDTSVGNGPMQLDENGDWINDSALRWGETIVWRVVPAPDGSEGVVEDAATVIARMPRTTVATRLSRTSSGALAFATVGIHQQGIAVELHVTDGSEVTTTYTVGGRCTLEACFSFLARPTFYNPGVYLSPDGASLIMQWYSRPMQLFMWMNTDPADRVLQPFGFHNGDAPSPAPVYYPAAHGGAAWLSDAVALWTGGDIMFPGEVEGPSLVQVFEATPPRAIRFEYVVDALPGATREPVLVGVIAVNDHLVLTTTTGVRILDARGNLVGGTEPFACGAVVTAAAEQVGPTTVAVGVGNEVITFEVDP